MVGGTRFHRRILKASPGGMSKKQKQQQPQKQNLNEGKVKTLRPLEVSLDNADTVIDGCCVAKPVMRSWFACKAARGAPWWSRKSSFA